MRAPTQTGTYRLRLSVAARVNPGPAATVRFSVARG
jgi:hypothetical protein